MELLTDVTLFKHKIWAFEYADRMEKWFNDLKPAPIRIDAELHTRCNLNCKMCDRRGSSYERLAEEERNKIELSSKKWINIAEESGKMGVKAWNISGLCEPLMRPDILFPIMQMIKSYDMFGELTTNGTLWNDNFIKKTIEMGWDSVCISIDAPDEKTHDYIRGTNGTFKKSKNTLENFNFFKKNFKVDLPVITINVVLNRLNYSKLNDIVEMCHNLGGNAIFVEPMVVFSQLGNELKMNKKEIDEFQKKTIEAKEKAEEYGIVLDITSVAPGEAFSPDKKFDKKLIEKSGNIKHILINESKHYSDPILSIPCFYPWFFLMIRGDGTITHCGEWKNMEENIKDKTLSELWFGDNFSKVRNQFLNGELSDFCEKCRPNIIEDTRIVRKSIKEFRDISFLRKKYLEFLEDNKRLKQKIFSMKRKNENDDIRCIQCEYKRELYKFKNSLTFKIFSNFWKVKPEKLLKKFKKY